MLNRALISAFSRVLIIFLLLSLSLFLNNVRALDEDISGLRAVVRKDDRKSLVVTEYGEISATDISDGIKGLYHLQFITLEPNSLFLPVLLHANMVFFVHTGSGRLSWTEDQDEMKRVNLRRGDIYRLQAGSIFYLQSNLEQQRQKLRVYAIFANTDDDSYEPLIGTYSSISNLVQGFDKKVLQEAFKVPKDVIEAIKKGTKPPAIVHALPTKEATFWELEARFLKSYLGGRGCMIFNKKKKTRTYNIFEADPDFENFYGWSKTVGRRNLHLLKGSNIGLFMVNLTKGSMMGPHWNPMATEIAIVLHGHGMVRVVCSSSVNESECQNARFRVKEGDVFAVPRFHPMAQLSFNNDSLVFMGFSTTRRRNHPQFLAGKSSVLQTLDRQVLAVSLNVTNTTISELLAPQADSIILECTSCAEEEERIMVEEIEKEKEARKREEEEEARKREEEETRKREEEERKREEEERKREEEEARKREEEERKREEEEEARRREEEREREEEERKRREEEAEREEEEGRRQEEEREKREREEEERKRQEEEEREQEEEEDEEKQRQEEREQEKASEREEERERRERQEEEAKRRQEEAESEEEEARRQEDERRRRRQEEEARKEREEQEEEPARKQPQREQEEEEEEEKQRQEEREQEKASKREEERERRERQGEKERRRQEEEAKMRQEEAESEEEEASRQEDERRRRREEEEEETRKEREQQKEPGRRQPKEGDWREEHERQEEKARREEQEEERRVLRMWKI